MSSSWLQRGSRIALAGLLAAGCQGKIVGDSAHNPQFLPGSRAAKACTGARSPGAAPLRRLTNDEWKNTVGDLLAAQAPLAATLAAAFTPETVSLGFRDSAQFLDVQDVLAQQYMDAADQISTAAAANLSSLTTCNPATTGADTCAQEFIGRFGAKIFRRPLTTAEVSAYQAAFDKGNTYGFSTGIQWVLYTMLQSPNFLYRPETLNVSGAPVAVAPYELATRLSYLFWHSLPDDELFAAAANGQLATPSDVQRETVRMLADPKARRSISFYEQWLEVDQLPAMVRDATLYPTFNDTLRGLFQQETDSFLNYLLWDGGDQTFSTFMSAPFSMMNGPLAQHYGVSGPTGNGFQLATYATSRRTGILAQAAVLTEHDKPTRSSIVRRGLKVRTQFLCQTIGAPPNGVNLDLGTTDPNDTQEPQLAAHRTNASCAACHDMMDPVGMAFEELDALARTRSTDEQGRPITAQTSIAFTNDLNGAIDGEADLSGKLAGSEQVHACVTTQLFRFSFARQETNDDACTLAVLQDTFQQSGFNLMTLTQQLTQTDAFLYQPVAQ